MTTHPQLTYTEIGATRHAIAKLVGDVALHREQPTPEVLDTIVDAVLRASRWTPPERLLPPPPPITITRDPESPGRIRRWLIARRLGLRCLVCNRRAGYGGRCPNPEHNA